MKILDNIINKIVDEKIEKLENRIFKKGKSPHTFASLYLWNSWDYEPKTLEEEITDYGEKIDAIAKFLKVEFKNRPSREEELIVKKIKKGK